MSTKYTKKHKIPKKNICIACKRDIGASTEEKCHNCDRNETDRFHYWLSSAKRKNPARCISYCCNGYVMPEDRNICFDCFVKDYYDDDY